MKLTITGRHVEISDAFREVVTTGFEDLSLRHTMKALEVAVVLSKDGYQFVTDIHAHVARGLNIRVRGEGSEGYSSFQNALDKLQQRLRRHKKWLSDHKKLHDVHFEEVPAYVLNGQYSEAAEHEEGVAPAIIAEMKTDIPTLTVAEAVARFDCCQDPTYIFRNSKHGELNVLYRRTDGHIGWVDPQGLAQR